LNITADSSHNVIISVNTNVDNAVTMRL